jgi:cystathionine beta-lyase
VADAHPYDALTPEALRARESGKWRLWPAPVLPAWVADMDFPVSPEITRALQRLIDTQDLGYPRLALRHREFAGALGSWMDRHHGWTVDPALTMTLTDVVQGIYMVIDRFTAPGDGVIIQTPSYPPFLESVNDSARRIVVNPLVPPGPGANRYELDFDQFAEQAADAKLLIFCHPQNPTGRVWSPSELRAVSEIVIEHDLIVVSDEIWADLLAPGQTHLPLASLGADIAGRTITLTSASKPFNIAGLRAAAAVFGSVELLDRARRRGPVEALGALNSFGLVGSIAAYEHGDEWLADTRAYIDVNRALVAERLAVDIPEIAHVPGESTYLAWLDCERLPVDGDARRFFVDNAKVGLSDGSTFGYGLGGHTRLNFATSRPILNEILDRMAQAVSAFR